MNTPVRIILILALISGGAFIHGFLSVEYLGSAYGLAMGVGAVVTCLVKPR